MKIIINFILTVLMCSDKNENNSQMFGGINDEDTEKKTGHHDHGILGLR